MTRDNLENLAPIGKLKAESPSQREIDGLIRSGLARLKDSENPSLAMESRFDLAYNAAHALSLAARGKIGATQVLVGQGTCCQVLTSEICSRNEPKKL